ncbi:type IV pilus modification PilV family protein [Pseudodesulfovibrio tunisiensis]|uniref:type IV pilus modification PilV family protein n=1 Tax=Pseudodesulfovibrio tunisiensis TaxID=463192 RepID=UPI001FB32F45|nr:prepilin-type N-terminal cleavage/methylation domain-containing protein [Pseudodesulfovibrio tunisiensis]
MRSEGFTLIEVLVTLVVLSIGALSVMKFASQTQEVSAEISHTDAMSRLAGIRMLELEKDGFSSSFSRSGGFDDEPGYEWSAGSVGVNDDGWYRMVLEVRRRDTGRTVILERVFRELL